ncbi:MAG: hypothetical protein A3C56_05650 [Ignavibacteria bacterium RIFCSPHIGHO2_02_FULL_56_12]|nr:MAG: hypothetical protein A3C56_05650 [Ignavibacteria bacterium RIFCSPHIGHO2_02_FULL_56_12]
MPIVEITIGEDRSLNVRLVFPVEEAAKARDDLKSEYKSLPKLNKATFESFATWVSDDIDEALGRSISSFYEPRDKESKLNIESPKKDDDPSTFEPW